MHSFQLLLKADFIPLLSLPAMSCCTRSHTLLSCRKSPLYSYLLSSNWPSPVSEVVSVLSSALSLVQDVKSS